jgi:hypothetical protein
MMMMMIQLKKKEGKLKWEGVVMLLQYLYVLLLLLAWPFCILLGR